MDHPTELRRIVNSCIERSDTARTSDTALTKVITREYARAAVMCATLAERLERVDAGQITR
jgi:hypothetical protein